MKSGLFAIGVLLLGTQFAFAASGGKARKVLNENIDQVTEYCLDPSTLKNVKMVDLSGPVAKAVREARANAAKEELNYVYVEVGGFELEGQEFVVISELNTDGGGQCSFYLASGSFVGLMSGTESSGWDEVTGKGH